MANLCIKTPSSAFLVLIFQLLVLRPRPNVYFSSMIFVLMFVKPNLFLFLIFFLSFKWQTILVFPGRVQTNLGKIDHLSERRLQFIMKQRPAPIWSWVLLAWLVSVRLPKMPFLKRSNVDMLSFGRFTLTQLCLSDHRVEQRSHLPPSVCPHWYPEKWYIPRITFCREHRFFVRVVKENVTLPLVIVGVHNAKVLLGQTSFRVVRVHPKRTWAV